MREFQQLVNAAEAKAIKFTTISRFDFYGRSRAAFAIVATGETRLYGNILVKKGVVRPER